MNRILGLLPIVAIMLIFAEIVLTNGLAPDGHRLHALDMEIDDMRQANALLEQKVASASSLTTIGVRAKEAGFVEPAKSQFVAVVAADLPVALNTSR